MYLAWCCYQFSPKNFIFNGDYVDKGAWGLETFLLLLALKVFMPQNIYLHSGNHESESCTLVYGFKKEVFQKYGDNGGNVYRKCLDCFAVLPLASIVAYQIQRTVLDPCSEDSDIILADILWSDPTMTAGLSQNDDRGVGLFWGPDCTEQFLLKNNLKLIIRSHEDPDARDGRDGFNGMDEGYTIDHSVESGKHITVFSAPDYPQFHVFSSLTF
ncbi:Serine/threonine-protein phosphatase [Quillaja saponaria]|uniref:Serine/threonine-protein phosphatase n=1 Tax=Quillaja saponaria TaxID=32244 RepID=A0AAD7KXS4_QUISA|nr:Serine/threonine-protein phosphatase [Quillaja saponaria]